MTQYQIKNTVIILISIALFFVDLMLFAIMQRHSIDPLLCFFIALLPTYPQHPIIFLQLLLLAISCYLDTCMFGSSLLYTLPALLIFNYLDQHLHVKIIIPYLVLLATLCLKMTLAYCMHDTAISWNYALPIIASNLFFLAIMSIIVRTIETKCKNQNSPL